MKKMMMLVIAAFAVGFAHAAACDWSINLGKTDGANKQYYVFLGSQNDAVMAALESYDSDAISSLAKASGTLNAKAGKASGAALEVGTDTSLIMVVFNETPAAGATYKYDTMDISGVVYTPPATSPGTFEATAAAFTKSGTAGGGDVPEPTSGLLLLVGGAMLALRRKQK